MQQNPCKMIMDAVSILPGRMIVQKTVTVVSGTGAEPSVFLMR